MLVAPLFSVSQQEEKQGLQKDAPSEGSSTKSTSNQDEWETIPINTFWIHPVYCLVLLVGSLPQVFRANQKNGLLVIWGNFEMKDIRTPYLER